MKNYRRLRLMGTVVIWVLTLALCGVYGYGVQEGGAFSNHTTLSTDGSVLHSPDKLKVSENKDGGGEPLGVLANILAEHRNVSEEHVSASASIVLAFISVGITALAFLSHLVANDFASGKLSVSTSKVKSEKLRRVFGSQLFVVCVFFLLPALAFFATQVMHHHPDSAVLVMAIAAIYVAGEHFASLESQKDSLDKQVEELNKVKLELDNQVNDIQEAVGSIQNALGTAEGQKQIYRAFADPDSSASDRGIYAFYHHFEIDKAWWATGEWDSIVNSQQLGLFTALQRGNRENVLIVSPIQLPYMDGRGANKAEEFHNFIGLVWYWMVLRKLQLLQRQNDKVFNYRIVTAYTSLWVHVIDNAVFQIIGEFPDRLRVRELTYEMGDKDGRVVEWARREVRETASRGQDAEEYICALIARVAMKKTDEKKIKMFSLESIIAQLGGDEWCKEKSRFNVGLDDATAKKRCVKLLEGFLEVIGESQVKTGDIDTSRFEPEYLLAKVLQ
ncbi:hypothetical protein [Pseudomonas sp. PD9R]|uniref:hypothetical protein n=1 Tax=Pseudomonas sp. PD9R TaxID=2853534 RepID=UPI001C486CC1|nr:hypothetical protein [Pseudomonas sp. PD9R]MBV6824626.1 hypothetical protein [Pseudomonas sp. PD9R]